MAEVPLLDSQCDGMRSFVGALFDDCQLVYRMIDEPEAFLHPPQATLLGRMLTETWKIVTSAVSEKALPLALNQIREQVVKAIDDAGGGRITRDVAEKIRAAVKPVDGWDVVKEVGIAGIPEGDPTCRRGAPVDGRLNQDGGAESCARSPGRGTRPGTS